MPSNTKTTPPNAPSRNDHHHDTEWIKWRGPIVHSLYNICTCPSVTNSVCVAFPQANAILPGIRVLLFMLKSVISIHEAYELIYYVFQYVKNIFKHHKDSPPSQSALTRHSKVTTVPLSTDMVSYSSIVEAVVYATMAEQFKRTGKPLSDQFFDVAFGNGDHTDWSKWCGPIIFSLYNLCTNPAGAEIIGAVSSRVETLLSVIGGRLFILKSLMSIYEAYDALIHMFEGGKILLGYH